MRIVIETIPHEEQAYDTVGDWWIDEAGTCQIRVSEMPNDKHAMLIGIHELVEMALCVDRGITQEQVDAFDVEHLEAGKPGEPGDDPAAPYHREHETATHIERQMAHELGIDWDEYGRAVDAVQ